MTSPDFRSARLTLGLSCVELAQILDVSERTVRVWEKGVYKGRPAVVPHLAAIVMRLATKYPMVRRELGLRIEGDAR